MSRETIITEIDGEIRRLTEARNLLMGTNATVNGATRGRPRLVTIAAAASTTPSPAVAVRKSSMSPEGRKRIADAMRKRWAEKRSVPVATKKAAKTATKK